MVTISVVVATRDRPELLPRSLRSVAAQTHRQLELVVVDDSETEAARVQNGALVAEICPGARLLCSPAAQRGSGPSAPRNHGIVHCTGDFVGFLDDDDEWIDPDYLAAASEILGRDRFDAHVADQEAVRPDGSLCAGPIWTEDLAVILPQGGMAAREGTYEVPAGLFLRSGGVSHLNTLLVRRAFLEREQIGFNTALRYEEDMEFVLRVIDRAASVGYTPRLVARHHVPAASGRVSASTMVSAEARDAARLRYLADLIASARQEPVRVRCQRERVYTLKRVAEREAGRGNLAAARRVGMEALRASHGAKWALFMGWLWARSLVPRRPAAP